MRRRRILGTAVAGIVAALIGRMIARRARPPAEGVWQDATPAGGPDPVPPKTQETP